MHVHKSATCVAAFLLTACAGDGEGLDENGRPLDEPEAPLSPQFDSIQREVLTPVCTACHSGAAAPLGLRLDEGASYGMLVNAASVEVPSLLRVQPGNPDASYLIQKLEGTASVGARMPLNLPPLPAETIAVIRQWIADGAQAAAGAQIQTKAAQIEALWPLPGAALRESPREIVVSSNVELDTTLLSAGTVTLHRDGGDGGSAAATMVDVIIAVRSLDPTVIALTAAPEQWITGRYELRINGSEPLAMADRAARPIDGDADGEPGGDFVLRFTLEDVRP